ncbi:MAG TPA: 2,3-bisphosphoglycerate-independent phosphoglycerate mutase, partial [bacterium]|nr:2,3-bisphosphoglycerate-independent phosphoglycerate mutase [bacterium]
MKKKIIFIVIDGLGDRPIKALNNKTPLEAAKTLNLDFLAKKGLCGLVFPFRFPYQKFPRSDSAHLALFGYNPKTYYLGRGPYEAAGIGMKIKKGDLIFRVNFGTVNKNLKIVDRRAGRINNIEPLVKSLSGITIDGVKFLINNSWGHRAVLILRAKNISEKISNGDIKKIGIKALKIVPLEESKKAIFTAEVLNKFLAKSYQILNNHPLNKKREKKNLLPANYLLIRGVGKLKKTISFKKKYKRNASCIAGGSLYKGIAKVLGMDLVKVKGADGSPNTNLKGKINAVKKALKKYNFVFLHIKAADNLAEDGKFKKK